MDMELINQVFSLTATVVLFFLAMIWESKNLFNKGVKLILFCVVFLGLLVCTAQILKY